MAMLEVSITLRVDFDTADEDQKRPIMIDVAKQTAKELLTQAMMMAGQRRPQIAVQAGDSFFNNEEIMHLGRDHE